MSLSSKQFKEIFKKGYKIRYEDNDNGESQLRCFECGEKAEFKKKGRRWRIRCENKHKWHMYDYLLEYTIMRDGITKNILKNNCKVN